MLSGCFGFHTVHKYEGPEAFAIKTCTSPEEKHQNVTLALGASEYQNIAEDLFPNSDHSNLKSITNLLPVVPDSFDGNNELKAHADFILSRQPIVEYFAKQLSALCAPMDLACRELALRQRLGQIYRRTVPAEELQKLLTENSDLSFLGLSELIFFAPEFHLKSYSNQFSADDLIAKISMGLFGTFPDAELIRNKEQVAADPVRLRQQIERLLRIPKFSRRLSLRLWRPWLAMNKLENMDLPANAKIDTRVLLDQFFARIEAGTAAGEGLEDLFYKPNNSPVPVSLITHPAFALATSRVVGTKLSSHYVQRGININTRVLCSSIPPLLQATIEELEESKRSAAGLTVAQTIEFHRRNPRCASCHSKIDPVGVSLERLDPFGKYRTKFEDGSPIQIHGKFLGREVYDLDSLVRATALSAELKNCFMVNLKSLVDGPQSKQLASCDAKEVFNGNPNRPILDVLAATFESNRFKIRQPSSEEFDLAQAEEFVANLYTHGLGRTADEGGAEYWLRVYRERGMVPVAQGILQSQEMGLLNLHREEFVFRSFKSLTGRDPTASEFNMWIARHAAVSVADFVRELVLSDPVKSRYPRLQGEFR